MFVLYTLHFLQLFYQLLKHDPLFKQWLKCNAYLVPIDTKSSFEYGPKLAKSYAI